MNEPQIALHALIHMIKILQQLIRTYSLSVFLVCFQASKSELQLHRNSHQFLENQSLVMSSSHLHKSESKLLDSNLMHETNTEVSLVTGVEYGGGPEAVSDNSATTVLKGKS